MRIHLHADDHSSSRVESLDVISVESPIQLIKSMNDSFLVYATASNSICFYDVQKKTVDLTLKQKSENGMISAMIFSDAAQWMITGTSLGFMTLWDLRFGIAVKSWVLEGEPQVLSLCYIPINGRFSVMTKQRYSSC